MFGRMIHESLWRPQYRRRALWGVLAVGLGTAVAAALLNVSLDVGDKVGRELRALGANIVISPAADSLPVEIGGVDFRPVSEGSYLTESSLSKLKTIFWRNNILAFAPFLYVPARVANAGASAEGHDAIMVGTWFDRTVRLSDGEEFRTGIRALNPSWKLDGAWVNDSGDASGANECVLGRSVAESLGARIGDSITITANASLSRVSNAVSQSLRVTGILATGGAEDQQIFTPLAVAQSLAALPDKVRKVEVSALIKPDDELSRRDPNTLTPAEFDRWYCSPYISSIQHQIREALPEAVTRAVRPVAETQGNVLGKLTFLMAMLAVLALVASALSISSLASLTVLERQREIGLMKALGANNSLVASLFFAEAAIQGIAGGLLGFIAGQFLARAIGQIVFGSDVAVNWLLLPMTLLAALGVSFAGTWVPLRTAINCQPVTVLRGSE